MFNNSPLGIFLFDDNGNLLEGNTSESNSFSGFSSSFSYGKNFTEIIGLFKNSEELLQIFKKRAEDRAKGKELKPMEIELIRQDGEKRWLHWQSSTVQMKDQTVIQAIVQDITNRKKAEVKLRESEEKYRILSNELESILDIIPGMLFCKDRNDVVTRVNQQFADSLNLKKEDLIGKTTYDLFPIDQAEKFRKDDLEVYHSGKPIFNIEETADFPDGNIWSITNKTPYYNEEGEISGIIGLSIDITERVKAEQKLKESEEQFRTIAEQSFMGIEIIQDGVFKYFNKKAVEIHGYTAEEIKNWEPYEFLKIIYPDDKNFVIEQVQKKESGDHDVITHYKYRIIKNDGEVRWVENYSKTINYKEKPADFVMTIDINDKIEAENKIKESEEKFRKITEESLLAICIIQDDIIKYVNQKMANLYGYTVEEMLNWGPGELLKTVVPESLEMVREQLKKK